MACPSESGPWQWEPLSLAVGNQLLPGGPWQEGVVLGNPPQFCSICKPESSFSGVRSLVLFPHPYREP